MKNELDQIIRKYKKLAMRWMAKRRNQRRLTVWVMGLVIASLFFGLVFSLDHSSQQNYLLVQRQKKLHSLTQSLKAVQKQKTVSDQQLKQKTADEASLKAQIDNLNKQLQAKAEAKKLADSQAAATVTYAQPISTNIQPQPLAGRVVAGCGDNSYANFIYMHESGCNTGALNSGGCFGIGQACPGSKLAYCGTDYACQNAFFTAYAAKYGGWAGSYAFWVAHSWW